MWANSRVLSILLVVLLLGVSCFQKDSLVKWFIRSSAGRLVGGKANVGPFGNSRKCYWRSQHLLQRVYRRTINQSKFEAWNEAIIRVDLRYFGHISSGHQGLSCERSKRSVRHHTEAYLINSFVWIRMKNKVICWNVSKGFLCSRSCCRCQCVQTGADWIKSILSQGTIWHEKYVTTKYIFRNALKISSTSLTY